MSAVHKSIYLDHNATTPIDPEMVAHIPEWAEQWGNTSSIHWAGRGPKALLREARQNIAKLLNVEPLELIFTSGGSEANNLALKGICDYAQFLPPARVDLRDQIVISAVEHPSVRQTAEFLSARGYQLKVIPVSREGQLDMDYLRQVLSTRTALVSVMFANNETGHIFPVREVARLAHEVGALMHCDAVQGLGKAAVNLRALDVDLASLSGHKFYALKGCGVLFVHSLIHGGGQERGRRAGTENILSIASFSFMASHRRGEIAARAEHMRQLRDQMETRILAEIGGVAITGREHPRVPNTSSLVIKDVDGETLLMNLDVQGWAVSTGAACSAGSPEPSPTLLAMGLTRAEAQSSLRLSLGWHTLQAEIDQFVDELVVLVARLRGFKQGGERKYV